MIKRLASVFFLTCCVIASAKAERGCFYPLEIKLVDYAYQVKGVGGIWQSPKVKEKDFIDSFVGATFRSDKGQELKDGQVECTYLTGRSRWVTLRYITLNGPESMSMNDNSNWAPATDPLGQTVYICQDRQPDNCKFTVEKSKR